MTRPLLLIGAALGATLILVATVVSPTAGAAPVVVEIALRQTRFEPSVLEVRAGTAVHFVVHNDDPIDHELLLGDQAAQDAHEHGAEARHGTKPGEVSVPAMSSASTVYRFDEPGVVLIGCHLPGHWDHGMRGQVIVVPPR